MNIYKLNFGFSSTPCLCLEPNVRYLIFYTFKKPEPIHYLCVYNIPIILTSKSIYNFASNLALSYFALQFLW